MAQNVSSLLGLALTLLRMARGWTQTMLARAAGISRQTLSAYEKGVSLDRDRLAGLAAILGEQEDRVDVVLFCADLLRPAWEMAEAPFDPTPQECRAADRAAATLAQAVFGDVRAGARRELRAERAKEDRAEAVRRGETLLGLSPEAQRDLVREAREYQTWAMAEWLCHESERAAAADPGRARELAGLALEVAERSRGGKLWLSRLKGYVLTYLSNSQRVANDLPEADRTTSEARPLWAAGAGRAWGDDDPISRGTGGSDRCGDTRPAISRSRPPAGLGMGCAHRRRCGAAYGREDEPAIPRAFLRPRAATSAPKPLVTFKSPAQP